MATEAQLRAQLNTVQDLEQASQLKVISLKSQMTTADGNVKTLLLQAEIAAAKGEADVASSLAAQAREQLALLNSLTQQRDQEQSVANSLFDQKSALELQVIETSTGGGEVQSGSTNTGSGATPNPPTPDKKEQPDTTVGTDNFRTDEQLLNDYNEARKDIGLPALTSNDPAALEYIEEQRIANEEADPFPFIQQPNTTLTSEQNGEGFNDVLSEADPFPFIQQPNTTLTPEQNGEALNTEDVAQRSLSERLNDQRSADFGSTIEVSTPEVALLDLTAGKGQPNPNLVTAKNILNTGQKAAFGSGAKDWRFRVSLAPGANYLYKASPAGILQPLQATDGVIFPYTPAINITYSANYNAADLTHTNYKIYNYHNSAVENVGITGDFTAQDSAEANYLLAVIHFFKSVTKMFYGQDQNPSRGIPPPLVYLSGFGQYQFDKHPCVITNFTYNMPVDVDYINAYPTNNSSAIGGVNMQPYMPQIAKWLSPLDRLRALTSKIQPGGLPPPPAFQRSQNINEITRVPTKISIQLTAIPIVTRNAISNQFSLKRYATGELMRGSTNPKAGGGIW
jgi:hypothetical protein